MYQLKRITADNFMSFDKVEYDFENKCYVVNAVNLDNSGQQSNGSGKSSFIDIIAMSILGYSLTGRNAKDCCNWHNNELRSFYVSVTLKSQEHEVYIERKFYSNTKSSELVILVDSKVPTTIPSKSGVKNGVDIKEGSRYILQQILDITETDLLNYFLISKSHYQPFLEVNTDKKLEVISRFTNTKAVEKAISKVESDQKKTQQEITQVIGEISKAQGYIEAYQSNLNEDAEKQFDLMKSTKIFDIEEKIKEIEAKVLELDAEQEEWSSKKISLQETFTEIDKEKEATLKAQYDEISDSELNALKSELNEDIQHAKNHLSGLITCPKCTHKFNLRSTKEYTEEDVVQFELDLVYVQNELGVNKLQREDINQQIQQIKSDERANKQTQSEIDQLTKNITFSEQRQQRLLEEIDTFTLNLNTESSRTFADNRADINDKIKTKETEIETLQLRNEKLAIELDANGKWVNHFEEFKFFLGNKPTQAICSLVNKYLKQSGSDLSLQIEGFKKLKNGEIRQSLNPIILRDWMNPQPYASFSEGEKVRLNLATDMAFQYLINCSSKGGLNLMVNDEMISGLDSLGVGNTADAFNSLDKTILLVTHSGADLNYSNTITVQKQNNKSEVI